MSSEWKILRCKEHGNYFLDSKHASLLELSTQKCLKTIDKLWWQEEKVTQKTCTVTSLSLFERVNKAMTVFARENYYIFN